ncbi:MAG: hypothetical protein NTZ49_01355 [Candidatus Parcubacteria bacterium]|nr:hypothetical protein [Candidatus Parcubacteria bacterium]
MKKYLLITLICLSILLPCICLAQGFSDAQKNFESSGQAIGYETGTDYSLFIAGMIKAVLSLVGVLFAVLMLYGGFLWMTSESGADKNKIDKAKKVFKTAVIGIVIIISAYATTAFIANSLEKSAQTESTPIQ